MKYLAIIATRDFNQFWDSRTAFTDANRNIFIIERGEGRNEKPINDISNAIAKKNFVNSNCELGVIFHKINGDEEANLLRESLKKSFGDKLAFCEWYSSTKSEFWNEATVDDDMPYNNLRKAWKDGNGNKEITFEAVWNFFFGDTKEETLTDNIFNAIYEQKNDDSIEKAVSKRDKYIKEKSNN